LLPSLGRTHGYGHGITSALEGEVPATGTKWRVATRIGDWFGAPIGRRAGPGARFAVEAGQPLPMRTLGRDAVMLVVGARTLLGELDGRGGYYDDLVTVAPPLRVTCGIQMRF
jgi:hypothetical protein